MIHIVFELRDQRVLEDHGEWRRLRGSKGAPVPIAGYASDSQLRLGSLFGTKTVNGRDAACTTARTVVADSTLIAIVAGASSPLPHAKIRPAVFASSSTRSVGVEASMLVERDHMRRVGRAEDVTATATVMTAGEEGEGSAASGRVAGRGAGVGLMCLVSLGREGVVLRRVKSYLPVVLSRHASHILHKILVPLVCDDPGDGALENTVAEKAPGDAVRTGEAHECSIGAVEAVPSAEWWSERRSGPRVLADGRVARRSFGGTQHGRHV